MTVATTFLGKKDATRFEITVEIGEPYRYGRDPEEWACPVALRGLHDPLPDIYAGDAFQALCLAVRLAHHLLTHFKDKGGKILFHDGLDEVPLESYALKPPTFGSERRN